jgi:hypothetical protein
MKYLTETNVFSGFHYITKTHIVQLEQVFQANLGATKRTSFLNHFSDHFSIRILIWPFQLRSQNSISAII